MTIADLAVWRLLGWIFGGALDGISLQILQSYRQINAHFQTMEEKPELSAEELAI